MGINQGLCGLDSHLYAAWKGEVGDDRLFYSIFDGSNWAAQKTLPGNSGVGPGLAATSAGAIVAAWKAEQTDNRLFFASYSTSSQSWSNQQQIPGHRVASARPSRQLVTPSMRDGSVSITTKTSTSRP
jgi:hypothetical protein